MSVAALAPSAPPRIAPTRLAALAAGALATLAWSLSALAAPAPAFQGWLIAFAFWSGPSVGALVLLLIERLTGGRWGEAFATELEPAARATPLLLLLAAPLLLALPALYPWAATPGRVDASVRTLFLNPVAYTLLGASALVGWSVLAWRSAVFGRLGAGLALVFHGVVVSLVAVQAIVSVSLGVTNSAAGMSLTVAQLVGGLGWAALQGTDRPARRPAGDLGGLLVAATLGLSYLVFTTWLVAWYGDRPNLNGYWIPRTTPGWGAVALAALALGLLLPAGVLGARRRVGVRRALRIAGGSAWAGLALYAVWLFAPSYGPACLGPALLAWAAQGGLWLAATGGAPRADAAVREAARG